MTEKEIQDGKIARTIFRKHLNNLKQEFLENGFELNHIMGINGSFGWDYANKESQNDN